MLVDIDCDGNGTINKDKPITTVPIPEIIKTVEVIEDEFITDGQRRTLADISHNKCLTQTHKDMLKKAYEDDNTPYEKAQHIIDSLNKFVSSKAS